MFTIKVHPNGGLNQNFESSKNQDFDECAYFVRLEDYHEKQRKDFLLTANKKFADLVSSKKGFNQLGVSMEKLHFLANEQIQEFLGPKEYMRIINVAFRGINQVTANSRYLACLNVHDF